MNRHPIGIYIHIPFCDGKCPYCDFYSVSPRSLDDYADAVISELAVFGEKLGRPEADSLYFGGGTPTLLGERRIGKIIDAAARCFDLRSTEITVETNPTVEPRGKFVALAAAGVNRLSVGLQSAVDSELKMLGRRHTADDAARTVEAARLAGIDNISLDLMLGIPLQTPETIEKSVEFCASLDASHISAYLLKLETGTPMYRKRDTLPLPNDDVCADRYAFACREIERRGYGQYEISNFARRGRESRHNLKYWHCDEYLGVGASAHSFVNGRRFYYPRDIDGFINSPAVVDDGAGGDIEEYIMLNLRLREGLSDRKMRERYGTNIPQYVVNNAAPMIEHRLMEKTGDGLAITQAGFLVSNSIIASLLTK